jgi:hypothetical protein
MSNGTMAALETVPGMSSEILSAFLLATKHASAHAFKIVYLTTLTFTGVGTIAAFHYGRELHLTNYVNKTIHKPGTRKKSQVDV